MLPRSDAQFEASAHCVSSFSFFCPLPFCRLHFLPFSLSLFQVLALPLPGIPGLISNARHPAGCPWPPSTWTGIPYRMYGGGNPKCTDALLAVATTLGRRSRADDVNIHARDRRPRRTVESEPLQGKMGSGKTLEKGQPSQQLPPPSRKWPRLCSVCVRC